MENYISSKIVSFQSKYEKNIDSEHRKDFGIFLTNNIHTVDKILNIVDFEDDNILNKKILEPSCGNGVFIIRFIEKLLENYNNKEIITEFISSNIYFVDIDEKMINKTKNNISDLFKLHFGEEFKGSYNGYVFDFTKKIKPKHQTLFDIDTNTPLTTFINEFDYIIGNPPYVTLYGRRDRKQNESQRVYYLNNYSQFPNNLKNGKINYIMLFIEQAIDLLNKEGKFSFIIDLSFFETAYEHTRKYLLENTKILNIEYNIKDFEAASGQIILKVQKSKVKNNIVKIINAENNKVIEIDQLIWKKPNDQYKFRFNGCTISSSIIEKIKAKKHPTLKSLYPNKNLRTCVMLLNLENLFVFDKPEKNLNVKIYPYYQGSKSLKYKFSKLINYKYFHYNKNLQDKINNDLKEELTKKGVKNKKRLGLGETIIYDNPKVYIRQSAKEIIASYDEMPSAANNSLYVFSLRDNSSESKMFLKFLCGLLNSDLITFYAQQEKIIRFSNGKQPQIKTSDLYLIPIPVDKILQDKIANFVDNIYLNINVAENLKEINNMVYSYFDITEKEIQTIKKSIQAF